MRHSLTLALASLVIVLGMTGQAFAGITVAPEIDGSTFSAGLGLLAAGVLIVRSRRGSK
jgi:MYXO-CTERM domain-containing protein